MDGQTERQAIAYAMHACNVSCGSINEAHSEAGNIDKLHTCFKLIISDCTAAVNTTRRPAIADKPARRLRNDASLSM